MPDHFSLHYVSDLAVDSPANVLAAIARQSRANNRLKDITGVLAFDGKSFAQYLEGSERAIQGLLEVLRKDTRHERLEVLELANTLSPRTFPGWRLGYLPTERNAFAISSLRGKRGLAAMEDFRRMLPALDIEAGSAIPAQWTGPQE